MSQYGAVKASAKVAKRRLEHLRTFALKRSEQRQKQREAEQQGQQAQLSAHPS